MKSKGNKNGSGKQARFKASEEDLKKLQNRAEEIRSFGFGNVFKRLTGRR